MKDNKKSPVSTTN